MYIHIKICPFHYIHVNMHPIWHVDYHWPQRDLTFTNSRHQRACVFWHTHMYTHINICLSGYIHVNMHLMTHLLPLAITWSNMPPTATTNVLVPSDICTHILLPIYLTICILTYVLNHPCYYQPLHDLTRHELAWSEMPPTTATNLLVSFDICTHILTFVYFATYIFVYGTYWRIWHILTYMANINTYCIWHILTYMAHIDTYLYMAHIDVYGTYWQILHTAHIDVFGTYWRVWHILYMAHVDIYLFRHIHICMYLTTRILPLQYDIQYMYIYMYMK